MSEPVRSLLGRLLRPCALSVARLLGWPLVRILGRLPGNPLHPMFARRGFHLLKAHYYLPIPQDADLPPEFWDRQSAMAGLAIDDAECLRFLHGVVAPHLECFRSRFPLEEGGDPARFHLLNAGYMAIDAHVYFSIVRDRKPRRIVEIGAGNSTLLAASACELNRSQWGVSCDLTAIDPFPGPTFGNRIAGLTRILARRVQDVDLGFFESLDRGDILFIDSSHVLRSGGDVEFEYLEILPRLRPGVLVHVHDISLPRPYPRIYHAQQLYWNEQQLLQALLAFTSRYRIVWPGNYLMLKYPKVLTELIPEYEQMRARYPLSEPTAFWFEVVDGRTPAAGA